MKLFRALFAIALLLQNSFAANYFVDSSRADNTGAGTSWATAKKDFSNGEALMSAGDSLYITGTHGELTITKDGTAGNDVNFVLTNCVARRIVLDRVSYAKVIGAGTSEITHVDSTYNDGVVFNDSCTNVHIWDLKIHDIHATHGGIVGALGNQPNLRWIGVHNCTISNLGIVLGTKTDDASVGVASMYESPFTSTNVIKADHWLIEYCSMQFTGDYTYPWGTNNIVRNNAFTLLDNDHWPLAFSYHSDNFQAGSDGIQVMSRHHIYERNWCGDQISADSHFGIIQDTIGAGDTHFIVRGNVAFNMDGGMLVISAKKVIGYHNSFYDLSPSSSWFQFYNPGTNTDYSVGSYVVNSISHTSSALYVDSGNSVLTTNNVGFSAGSHASYISTSDPLFVSPSTTNSRNFRLQASSPARNSAGAFITITSASGSGTVFNVSDGDAFSDGWGMVEGDTICIGGVLTPTRIVSISGNTVTVADSQTWTMGESVHWNHNPSPDIGALPWGSQELTAATLSSVGTIHTVNTIGDTRDVVFYEDGIPTTIDSTPPFQITSSKHVKAKARALYAQAVPVIDATEAGGGGGGPTGRGLPKTRHGF